MPIFRCNPNSPKPCGPSATPCGDSIFANIRVIPQPLAGVRVEWELTSNFAETGIPLVGLEVSPSGVSDATDWVAVGDTVENPPYLVDDLQRERGVQPQHYYRVVYKAGNGYTYRSAPAHVFGDLDFRSHNLARKIMRSENVNLRTQPTGVGVWILKRRRYGPVCTTCASFLDQRPTRGNCPECYGVGITGGYWLIPECKYAKFSELQRQEKRNVQPPGNVDPQMRGIRIVAAPLLMTGDVIVSQKDGSRYFVSEIKHAAEIQGVPLVYDPVALVRASPSDPIFLFEIPKQVDIVNFEG